MPFHTSSLDELIKRERISTNEFAKRLGLFVSRVSGIKYSITGQTVRSWRAGKYPPKIIDIDYIYLYAMEKRFGDLEFYRKP